LAPLYGVRRVNGGQNAAEISEELVSQVLPMYFAVYRTKAIM